MHLIAPVLLAMNLLFFVRFVTYVSNLRKIGQKLRSLSRVIATSEGQTNTQVIIYLSNAMNWIGQTTNHNVIMAAHVSSGKPIMF